MSCATAPASGTMTFTLDQESSQQVAKLAEESGIDPAELVGIALRILEATAEAGAKKRRILITSISGYPIKEIVIPQRRR